MAEVSFADGTDVNVAVAAAKVSGKNISEDRNNITIICNIMIGVSNRERGDFCGVYAGQKGLKSSFLCLYERKVMLLCIFVKKSGYFSGRGSLGPPSALSQEKPFPVHRS